MLEAVKKADPEIHKAIEAEQDRLNNSLELIPSENYVSPAVQRAMGSTLTNKYAEGFPKKRYYGGNKFIDVVETIAIERAKKLFGVSHANVQPYSGSPANLAATMAVANPGDKIMGMNLLFGGHLTHGWRVNFSAIFYNSVQYQTGPNGMLDYEAIEKMVKKEKPRLLWCGATAYPRLYDYKRLAEIAHSVDGYFIADIAHEAGLMAAGVVPSPVGHADIITSTTHKTLRGPRGGLILCNGNPSDPLKPCEKTRENLPTMVDRAVFPGCQGGPHEHIIASKAIAFLEAMQPEFKDYAAQILKNAKALAATLMDKGCTLTTGGTDNHLLVVDLRDLSLSGKKAESALDEIGITANKNTIPFDTAKPWNPSGIRMGAPAVTTRGFKESEMKEVGEIIAMVLKDPDNAAVKDNAKQRIAELCRQFPLDKAKFPLN